MQKTISNYPKTAKVILTSGPECVPTQINNTSTASNKTEFGPQNGNSPLPKNLTLIGAVGALQSSV